MHWLSSEIRTWDDGLLFDYDGTSYNVFVKWLGLNCISLGFHIDIENPALELHLPFLFCAIRIKR